MKTVSKLPWFRVGWEIRADDGSVVAISQPWDNTGCRQEDHANVNVMTAAPYLYKELRYAIECIENLIPPDEEWLERAKTAIMLAEGLIT